MRIGLTLGAIAVVGLSGCGSSGAAKEELHDAWVRGATHGHLAAQPMADVRVEEARERAYRQGLSAGRLKGRTEAWKEAELVLEEELPEEAESLSPTYRDSTGAINPHPINEKGEPSYEFEPDDIERAEEADPSVQEYCEGAVSEAQEIGCLSHVNPWEVP